MKPGGLRILMTTDAVGGVWVFSSSLADALVREGCEVLLVTLGPTPRQDQLDGVARKGVQVEVTDLALEWMDPEGTDFKRARQTLANIARRFFPDIVHLNSFRDAVANWQVPVVVTAHSCVRSWWQACRGSEPDERRWDPYIEQVRSGLAAADVWVAPSCAFRDTIEALYSPPASGVAISNGINATGPISAKEPYILAAGRLWDEAKNVGALAAVARDLKWPVRIAGAAETKTNSVAPPRAVDWLGELPRADLLKQMQRSAIFVAPALYEPFGLAVLEAASAGCALVLSDIPTFRELWNDAALFVNPNDPASLRTVVDRICGDSELRTRLQHAASRRAQDFPLERTTASYQRLYHGLLQAATQPIGLRNRAARPEVYA
jgi:glycosyltransferase involved in cell wall biosynthesis